MTNLRGLPRLKALEPVHKSKSIIRYVKEEAVGSVLDKAYDGRTDVLGHGQ